MAYETHDKGDFELENTVIAKKITKSIDRRSQSNYTLIVKYYTA